MPVGTLVPVPPFWPALTKSSEAAFTRMTWKNSDDGTKIENSRVGRLEPSGSFLITIILLKVLSLLGLGLRVPRHEEEKGLDLTVHGEEGYALVVPQIQAEERIAPLEVETAELYQRLREEQIANLKVKNSQLRQRLQEETAGLYHRREKRIVNLEVENRELHQRVKVINNRLRISTFEGS